MSDPDLLGIDPPDEPFYRNVIRREKSFSQLRDEGDAFPNFVRPVMILEPPSGWEPGTCVTLVRNTLFPFAYEVTINGYPGFGELDEIRFKFQEATDTDEFEGKFRRDAEPETIVKAFPEDIRPHMQVTGGNMFAGNEKTLNPRWSPKSEGVDKFLLSEKRINTGRYFIAFDFEPVLFDVAETDAPDDDVDDPPEDQFGFTTILDQRVTARRRKVPFVSTEVPRDCTTLVDTTVPTAIAAGALAYAARVPGLSLSLISVEPRIYQELSGVFGVDDGEAVS